MTLQRWTDEMLDRQAEQMAETRELANQLLESQRLLVQILQQEHEARVEADRRFNRHIENQDRLNQSLGEAIEELRQLVRFSRENGSPN